MKKREKTKEKERNYNHIWYEIFCIEKKLWEKDDDSVNYDEKCKEISKH